MRVYKIFILFFFISSFFISAQSSQKIILNKLFDQLTKTDKVGSAPDGSDAGASYYYKQDYLSDLSKKCQSKDFA